ncbi:hypothetical protein BDN71DRAFT_1043326 [Pleurotus eryngii]|uniref:Uncharacterized protein n=1 Tax=Pleurotus eryngii TaxID=5323 RepID=A0A9P6A6Z2_PLEER|nr:hypothetical protein BDN71DRAFT_1043326 [Pleurotus eryngii]
MQRLTLLNGAKPSCGVFLRLLRKCSKVAFEDEDDSVKEAVSEEFDRLEKEKENETEDPTSLSSFVRHRANPHPFQQLR